MASFDARGGFDWHGLQVPILVAHGFLKQFVWTLDFENRRFLFRSARSASPESEGVASGQERGDLEIFVGSYEVAPGVALEVSVGESGLLLQAPSQQKVHMTLGEEPDTFEIKLAGAVIEFVRDESGRVIELVLHQAGIEQRARRND